MTDVTAKTEYKSKITLTDKMVEVIVDGADANLSSGAGTFTLPDEYKNIAAILPGKCGATAVLSTVWSKNASTGVITHAAITITVGNTTSGVKNSVFLCLE